ncbi:MAG: molecular chaperone TorD family protein [Bacillota bacterium]|nr:molecular chaperone TorD family protein [Bacillota bacterium]
MAQSKLVPEKAREACYKLLSVCYQLPSQEWHQVQLIDGLAQALEILNSEAAVDARAMLYIVDETKDLTQLQVDFSKLFVGPSRLLAAPYASVYLGNERQVMTETTAEVVEFYHKIGIDIAESKEIPDHIRVELEVMYYLSLKERRSINEENVEEENMYKAFQKEFLERYLGIWIDDFTAQLEKEAPSDFFKHLARVTATFIHEDIARFQY